MFELPFLLVGDSAIRHKNMPAPSSLQLLKIMLLKLGPS